MSGKPIQPRPCAGCGELFKPRDNSRRYCKASCFTTSRRDKHPAAGTRYLITKHGKQVWHVLLPDGRTVPEHRVVFEQTWNVKLKAHHRVIHVNDDSTDNRPENLILSNPYAMEMLRQGKSIAEIGKTVCVKGHQKDGIITRADGRRLRYCKQCERQRQSDAYVPKKD